MILGCGCGGLIEISALVYWLCGGSATGIAVWAWLKDRASMKRILKRKKTCSH
jgi:hypothetical protein